MLKNRDTSVGTVITSKCPRKILETSTLEDENHYVVYRYLQPITQRRGVIFQKNGELKYSPGEA
jgi:hypothetical protein